jgi:hypothetical protein
MNEDYRAVNICMCYREIMANDASEMKDGEMITAEQRGVISAAIHRLSVTEVASRLGLSNETVLRIAGGFGAQAGSVALAVQRLGRLGE